MNFYIYFNNINVTPWANWLAAEINVQRGDTYSIEIQLQGVRFVETAYQYILSTYPQSIDVYLLCETIEIKGVINPGDITFYDNYVVVDITLGYTDFFTRKIEGRLLPDALFHKIPVVISPRTNAQAILTLVVSTFSISYIIIKESFEIQKDAAILLGITGAGPTGPVSATVAQVTILALRVIYVAALVVALVNLIKEIFMYIERVQKVNGCNLYEALEYFASQAGFVLQAPGWLKKVWIVGGDKTEYESGELFMIARQLTNSYVWVANGVVRFVPNTSSFPAIYRKAHEDSYKYNYNDIARKEIISFIRDTADDHCLGVPAAVEITRGPHFKGYTRLDISLASANVAGDRPVLAFVSKFLDVLALFSQQISNIQETYNEAYGYVIVERETFTRKIVYSNTYTNIPHYHMVELLQTVASYYTQNRLAKLYSNRVMPLNIDEFIDLIAQGFPGVISMQYNPFTGKANISYQVVEYTLADNYDII